MKTVSISVTGMHCASCALIIEKLLLKINGVGSASVNFASLRAAVGYDETKVDPEVLIKAIEEAGYKVVLLNGGSDRL